MMLRRNQTFRPLQWRIFSARLDTIKSIIRFVTAES